MSKYIDFDRHSDAQTSIIEFCTCIQSTIETPSSWKYAIISIHNALQGYMCISLGGGNNFQTWKDSSLKKWLTAYNSNNQSPETQLDYFMNLFDKVFSEEDEIDRKNIEWLNDVRNNFIHFNTDGYSIHEKDAYDCCKEALRALKLTPKKANGIFYYEDYQKESFDDLSQKAEESLSIIKKGQ